MRYFIAPQRFSEQAYTPELSAELRTLFRLTLYRACAGLLMAATALAVVCFFPGTLSAEPIKLSIIHFNDPHAHYEPYTTKENPQPMGGFAKALTVIQRMRSENEAEGRQTLTLMAGDLLTGTPFSMVFKGELGVKLMNNMGVQAMVVGNHEFDYGLANLLRIRDMMEFPLLSGNIRDGENRLIFKDKLELPIQSRSERIALMGITTKSTPFTTLPRNVKGLTFGKQASTAKTLLKDVNSDDVVIALTHIGVKDDQRLARKVPRINVIIGGHSHTALKEPLQVGQTVIAQAGAYAHYVGRVNVDVDHGQVVAFTGELVDLDPTIAEDPDVKKLIAEHKSTLGKDLDELIAVTQVHLEGRRGAVRTDGSTNFGRLIAYVTAGGAQADVGLINAGAIRSGIQEGKITLSDIYTALPFEDTVVTVNVSGATLERILNMSVSRREGSGGKLQTYGVDFIVSDGAAIIKRVAGKDFARTATYKVATNNYLAEGGDAYSIFRKDGTNLTNTGLLVTDLLVDYLQERKTLTAENLKEL